jgi:6-phosphogluconolactonase
MLPDNNLNTDIKIFSSPYELAESFAGELVKMVMESAKKKKNISIALSGGYTPALLFSLLADHYSDIVPWEYVNLFWGDERCVPPDDPESNYGMTRRKLIDRIDIPLSNVHRIRGENYPESEALRYSEEISDFTVKRFGLPLFDLVILGLGEDGHIASIFPGNEDLFHSDNICETAIHPVTLQKRITLTGRIINNADVVTFMVTGHKKADVVEKIINRNRSDLVFPASHVNPVYGVLNWLLDKGAGRLL